MANKTIDTVPFIEDYFYLHLRSNDMSLRKFMRKYGEYVGRTEKTIRRYLKSGQAPMNVVQRIADVLNVDVWYLTGRADCKNAVTFLREYRRMCNGIHPLCHQGRCPMIHLRRKYNEGCQQTAILNHPEEAVAIVQRWSDTHPLKTCGLQVKCVTIDEHN